MQIRVQDNVRAQHRLVTERFGIKKLVMVIGWSMGAGQTFQWGVRSSSNKHSSHCSKLWQSNRLLSKCVHTLDLTTHIP